jgi:putative PIN family toxin of toxin-antitoxin system
LFVVLDTNILVSAFWLKDSKPARIVSLVLNGIITPCIDSRIITEYRGVLHRKKFGFEKWEINHVLAQIENDGLSVVPVPLAVSFIDESDRKFYETAKHCNAHLITGNVRHYPHDPLVITPAAFLAARKE